MGVDHPNSLYQETQRQARAQKRNGKATMQNTSISRANFTVREGGKVIIEDGGLEVTGTATVTGYLNGDGTFTWTGPWELAGDGVISGDVDGTGVLDWTGTAYFKGPTGVQGNFAVSGLSNFTGDVTLNSDLSLGASGQILAGTIRINRFGSYGGQIVSTGSVLYLSAGSSIIVGAEYLSTNKIEATDIKCFTLDTLGSKNFRMPHPTKPKHWLRHGATESPISGTEYTGRATIGEDGSVVVELPEYFEALNKPDNRTVQVTPVGRPFPVGADAVTEGAVTVYGEPGRDVFWLVKAERFGGDFLLEEEMAAPPLRES